MTTVFIIVVLIITNTVAIAELHRIHKIKKCKYSCLTCEFAEQCHNIN